MSIDQSKYLQFPACKWARGWVCFFGQETFCTRKLDRSAQLLKRLSGRIELHDGVVFVSQVPAASAIRSRTLEASYGA